MTSPRLHAPKGLIPMFLQAASMSFPTQQRVLRMDSGGGGYAGLPRPVCFTSTVIVKAAPLKCFQVRSLCAAGRGASWCVRLHENPPSQASAPQQVASDFNGHDKLRLSPLLTESNVVWESEGSALVHYRFRIFNRSIMTPTVMVADPVAQRMDWCCSGKLDGVCGEVDFCARYDTDKGRSLADETLARFQISVQDGALASSASLLRPVIQCALDDGVLNFKSAVEKSA